MFRLIADRDVVKQVTDKLEMTENAGENAKNAEKIPNSDFHSKLQANKIIKSNHEGCILKDYYINGKHQRHWYKVDTDEDLGDAVDTFYFTENQRKEIKDLRIKYYDSMKTLFNTVFYNENKNLKAHFTKKSVDKICSDKAIKKTLINGFTTKDYFEAALNIKSLFEKAEFVGSFKDINDDPNVKAMHRFQQIIYLSSRKKAVAYMTVKESKEHGNKFYTLELMLKKYPSQLSKGFLQRLNNSESLTISCKPLDNFIIPNSNNLSIKKSLTYSGHKLQDRTTFAGMNISIENKKGSYRSGVDGDGHKWRTYMNYDYGYIRGTEGTDGDHVDCVSPETKILMANYTEKKASEINIGDELIGILLETKQYVQRKQIKTRVVNISKGVQDMLEIKLSNGVLLRTTLGHLHYKFKGCSKDKIWERADKLKVGDKLVMIFNHKNFTESNDYKKGYLFGAYLGDGSLNYDESRQTYCDIRKGEKYSDVIYRVKQYWNDLNIHVPEVKIIEPKQTNSLLKDGRKIISKMKMVGLIIRGKYQVESTREILTSINKENYEWCRGFICGIYDTDGCLNCRHEFQISQTKNQTEFMSLVINCLKTLGYKAVQRENEIKINSDFMADNVTMELTQILKPSLEQKRSFLGQTYRFEPVEIIDIKQYKGEFVAIQTDEQTYIANGIVTHNCYLGPDKDSKKVFVIHQNDPVTHKYDEDKCMLCFNTADEAKKAYMKQYDRPGFYGSMDTMTIDEFKTYVFSQKNKGKRIHKSFEMVISGITENNKAIKIDQAEKAMTAYYNNQSFIIKHIPEDNSRKYGNITVRINNFDKANIEKAVRKISFSLDENIGSANGEAFVYKSQEDLTNLLTKDITGKTKQVYQFIIDYLDLPEMRIVQKSKLRYKGQILYNPETGEAIKKSDWKKFVKALKEFMDKLYEGTGERIVIDSQVLGRILQKMSKTHSFDQIRKIALADIEKPHRTFDWISNTAKEMTDVLGNELPRIRQARIQSAIDSAAQRVTKITDTMRNDMQQIIIDGVKDRKSKSKISQDLFDKCVGLNRDFQRIADTEIQNNTTSAYINEEVYNTQEGEKVYFKRYEVIDGNTCKYCKEIKDTIALFSEIPLVSENIKDEYTEIAIWEGKKDGVPFGTCHPWCRGSWYRYYPGN